MAAYYLAQINLAKARAPLDNPIMAGFVEQLAPLNALAEASPGFVWRLQAEGGDATGLQAFPDPLIIVNMSVWESVEHLQDYAYRSAHVGAFRDRKQWFEKPEAPHYVLWWVPAGHVPTLEEAKLRLEHLRAAGPSAVAFTFPKPYPAPPGPPTEDTSKDDANVEETGSYDRRLFVLRANTDNGTCQPGTQFHYRQQGKRVWATYESTAVRFGILVASVDSVGRLTATYQHLDSSGSVRMGACLTRPEQLSDGRLRLYEDWHWIDMPSSPVGHSVLEEAVP